MRGEHIAGPYWVRTTTNGKHQVCGRSGATICEYRADQVEMADAHCRRLQGGFTKAEKALRDAAPDMLAALVDVVAAWDRIYPTLPVSLDVENAEFAEFQKARAAIARATTTAEGVA